MARTRKPAPPLNADALEQLALRYVERYATTRARLSAYLARKVRERGTEEESVDTVIATLVERMAELGYVNDRIFAEAKAAAMARRGYGARRVSSALHHYGIESVDADALAPEIDSRAMDAALAFARRRRIGPFADDAAERDRQQRQIAAMVRAGHDYALARKIVQTAPGADLSCLQE